MAEEDQNAEERQKAKAMDILKAIFRVEVDKKGSYLSIKDFLDELYIPVDTEEKIKNGIFNTNELTCVVGIVGSGKTSVLTKIFERDLPEGWCYLKIDFRKEQICGDPQRYWEFREKLRNIIKDDIIIKFYSKENEKYLEELSYLLIDDPKYEYHSIYRDFNNAKIDAKEIYRKLKISSTYTYSEWINSEKEKEEKNADLREIVVKDVMKKLDMYHLIWGLIELKICKRFFVVFDNVDILPHDAQPYYLEVANGIHHIIEGHGKSVISIREQNIRRPPITTTGAFGDNIEVVYIDTNNIPGIIHDKRIEHVDGFGTKIQEDGLTTKDQAKKIILKRLEYAEKIWKEKGIQKNEYKIIKELAHSILNPYLEERIDYMANKSIRVFLDIYMIFLLEHLMELEDTKIKELLESKGVAQSRQIETYLYSWLVRYGGRYGIHLYKMVPLFERWMRDEEYREQLGCFLPYIISVRLYNITNRGNLFTTVGNVINEFTKNLKVDSEEIRKSIYDLYSDGVNYYGHIVDIRQRQGINNEKDIRDTDQVWITPRGTILCSETSLKYMYILQELIDTKHFGDRDIEKSTKNEQAEYVLKFLYGIAYMHLNGLQIIRRIMYPNHEMKWLEEYKKLFCINGRLHLERILDSNIGYLKRIKMDYAVRNEFEKLKREYLEEVKHIERYGYARNIDSFKDKYSDRRTP